MESSRKSETVRPLTYSESFHNELASLIKRYRTIDRPWNSASLTIYSDNFDEVYSVPNCGDDSKNSWIDPQSTKFLHIICPTEEPAELDPVDFQPDAQVTIDNQIPVVAEMESTINPNIISTPLVVPISEEIAATSPLNKTNSSSNVPKKKKFFKCPYCPKKYTRRSNLNQHHIFHHADKQTRQKRAKKCPSCGKMFQTKSHLSRHMRGVHGVERRRQLQIRNDNAMFKCGHCNKGFIKLPSLQAHMRTHLNPINCYFCKKTVLSKSKLEEHMVVHTKEYPFKCTGCGIRFSWAWNLKRHVKKLHPSQILIH